ncbi:M48 family metallopeptidase [Gluconobacter cerinus]|uniref:tetratricopeptide repeat protein n=1 Tax=Gluconobacter cerinus TaxID=38307 RepID=UPI001B8B7ED1|nr:hypothetical protein [Gluconobacter cerinus]MBS0983679.1 hypothetical protein [Gluconobacter cerinus]
MTSYLLSWHGTLLASRDACLCTASFADVLLKVVTPVLVGDGYEVTPLRSGLVLRELPDTARPLCVLTMGTEFLSSRNSMDLDWTGHHMDWESFLPIRASLIPVLHALLSRRWSMGNGSLHLPRIHDFSLVIGEQAWPLETLMATREDDIVLLETEGEETVWILESCPPKVLSQLLNALSESLMGIDSTSETEWLNRQILKVSVAPHEIIHILYLALMCAEQGRLDFAQAFLKCARLYDERPDLIYFQAILSERMGDHAAATAHLSQALAQQFPDPNILKQFGYLETRMAEGENMLLLLPELMQQVSGSGFDPLFDSLMLPQKMATTNNQDVVQAYSLMFEQSCFSKGRDRGLALLRHEQTCNGVRYWSEICLGHDAWLSGDRAAADRHYGEAKTQAIKTGIMPIHYNCGVFSWLPENEVAGLEDKVVEDRLGTSGWTWKSSVLSGQEDVQPELCLVFGCDTGYFQFIPKLVLSLLKVCMARPKGGRIRLCLGIDSPTNEQLDWLEEIVSALSVHDYGLDFTFAHGPLTYRDGATYTAIRYLIFPKIAERWSCPVITADCDGYFPSDFLTLWEEMKATADYGFRLYAYDKAGHQFFGEPWGFGAGISYFGKAEKVPDIARFLHNYLQIAYNPDNPTNWCIDQCALVQAYKQFVAPDWETLRIRFMDDGTPLMVMPHHVGGKQELLEHEGTVSAEDVQAFLSA